MSISRSPNPALTDSTAITFESAPQLQTLPLIGPQSASNSDLDDFVLMEHAKPLTTDDFVVVDVDPTDDRVALLPGNQQPPSTSWISNKASGMAMSVKNTAIYIKSHPVTSLMAVVAAAPNTINAMVAPSHDSPSIISLDWYQQLSPATQVHAASNAVASFGVNVFVNLVFFPQAAEMLVEQVKHMFDSPKQFVISLACLLLGVSAATANGMIAYNSFMWLPAARLTALIPTAFSFLSSFTSRYSGVMTAQDRMTYAFSDNGKVHSKFADILQHIDDSQLERLRAEFDQIVTEMRRNQPGNTLTNDQFSEISKRLATRLDVIFQQAERDGKTIIKPATGMEKVQKVSATLFDISIALVLVAPASFLTHMQKGFEGVNLMAGFAGSDKLNSLNVWSKRGIGLLPAIAPAVLYGVCGYDIRSAVLKMIRYCRKHPGSIPSAVLLSIATVLSSGSMQSVAEKIVENPYNIIGFNKVDAPNLSTAFIVVKTIGGGVTNGKPTMNQFASPSLADITYDEFVHIANSPGSKFNQDTTTHVRSLGIFGNNRPTPPLEGVVPEGVIPAKAGIHLG